MHNVTLKRVYETIVVVENQYVLHTAVCVCVCARARALMSATCARVHADV